MRVNEPEVRNHGTISLHIKLPHIQGRPLADMDVAVVDHHHHDHCFVLLQALTDLIELCIKHDTCASTMNKIVAQWCSKQVKGAELASLQS
jgi:hypothetical protein